MNSEEIAGKCSIKYQRPEVKKYKLKIHFTKKIDVVSLLPPEALSELETPMIG